MWYNVTILWKTCTEAGGVGFLQKLCTAWSKKFSGIYCLIYPSGSVLWIQLSYAKHTKSSGDATEPWGEAVCLLCELEEGFWQHEKTVDSVLPQKSFVNAVCRSGHPKAKGSRNPNLVGSAGFRSISSLRAARHPYSSLKSTNIHFNFAPWFATMGWELVSYTR